MAVQLEFNAPALCPSQGRLEANIHRIGRQDIGFLGIKDRDSPLSCARAVFSTDFKGLTFFRRKRVTVKIGTTQRHEALRIAAV